MGFSFTAFSCVMAPPGLPVWERSFDLLWFPTFVTASWGFLQGSSARGGQHTPEGDTWLCTALPTLAGRGSFPLSCCKCTEGRAVGAFLFRVITVPVVTSITSMAQPVTAMRAGFSPSSISVPQICFFLGSGTPSRLFHPGCPAAPGTQQQPA